MPVFKPYQLAEHGHLGAFSGGVCGLLLHIHCKECPRLSGKTRKSQSGKSSKRIDRLSRQGILTDHVRAENFGHH